MRWFKHFTDGHYDRDMKEGIRNFGINAYSFYYILNEIYGLYYNDLDENGFLEIGIAELEKMVHLRKTRVELIMKFFEKKGKIIYKEKNNYLEVKIPQFIRLAGSWRIRAIGENVTPNRNMIGGFKEEEEEEERKRKKNESIDMCTIEGYEILDKLNKEFNKSFKNADFIINILRQGKKKEDFLKIIENKKNDNFFKLNPRLYNAQTLFKEEHFEIYLNEKLEKEKEQDKEEKKEIIKINDTEEEKEEFYNFLIKEMPTLQTEIYKIIYENKLDEMMFGMDFFDDIACYKIDKENIIYFPKKNMYGNYINLFEEIKRITNKGYKVLLSIPKEYKESKNR